MPHTEVLVYRKSDGEVPLTEWLTELAGVEPRAHVKCLELIIALGNFGYELREPRSKPLRDGIHELRAKVGTVNYRILYFFSGNRAAVLSHGFTKEKKVPPKEIDEAIRRRRQVKLDPETHTAEFEL